MPCGGIRSTPIRYCSARRAATSYRPRSGFDGAIFPRMRALTLIHRWLGIAFCLLFAMWFASGIVMHFVPFPALDPTERLAGLSLLPASIRTSPPDAVKSLGGDLVRLRLTAPGGHPVYVGTLRDGDLSALDAATGRPL